MTDQKESTIEEIRNNIFTLESENIENKSKHKTLIDEIVKNESQHKTLSRNINCNEVRDEYLKLQIKSYQDEIKKLSAE